VAKVGEQLENPGPQLRKNIWSRTDWQFLDFRLVRPLKIRGNRALG